MERSPTTAYVAALPEPARSCVERVRQIVFKTLPDATEEISYRILAYRLPQGVVLYVAGWKQHYSIYPVTSGLESALGPELAPYRAGKGTLRFPVDRPVPARMIAKIVRLRAQETRARK